MGRGAVRLSKVRVQNYRSVIDTGEFEVDSTKTILVGPNEAGKTAVMRAMQQLNPPEGTPKFDPRRDYPRRLYNDIQTKKVDPKNVTVVTAEFELEEEDRAAVPEGWEEVRYKCWRNLDNSFHEEVLNGPPRPTVSTVTDDLRRLAKHLDSEVAYSVEGETKILPSAKLNELLEKHRHNLYLQAAIAREFGDWLEKHSVDVAEGNLVELARLEKLRGLIRVGDDRLAVLEELRSRLPIFIYYNNYLRARPIIHLANLARRQASGALDDAQYDYGNLCLLRLLGFDVAELSKLGDVANQDPDNVQKLDVFRQKLDERRYALNAAEVRLSEGIREVWRPDETKGEAAQLRIEADGQYLVVSVLDDVGVAVELDQRSEGFQWLTSFFIVFFAEVTDKHENALLLLDEPGVSLHALKQRDFRDTISRLAKTNQTVYTTHSPFMVGPNELDRVRVVELTDRRVGTKVHTTIAADDPAALLPLQDALGYDLAQSLFTQKRNLVVEGITDLWYVEGMANLLREAGIADLDQKISIIPAGDAGKVVYYATILHAQNLKVAALLDSDNAGDTAAKQDALVHTLKSKAILRASDFDGEGVKNCETEDLIRSTLITIANSEFGKDVSTVAGKQKQRPIVDLMTNEIDDFSKYRLAKAFLRWCRDHTASDLSEGERQACKKLIDAANKALK